MEQKVKAGDYVILTDPLNNGECVKVLEVHDGGYIMYGGGISSMYKPMKNEGLIHKAKVCATGDEVTVLFDPIEDCYKQVVTCDEEKNDAGRVFSFEELDFIIDEKTTAKEDTIAHPDYGMEQAEMLKYKHDIDWEQRRYEIAKEVMPWCCRSFRDFLLSGADFDANGKSFAEHVSAQAVGFADALIERLKRKEQ